MRSFNGRFEILSILIRLAILCNQWDFISSKALIGHNIGPAEELDYPYTVAIVKIPRAGAQRLEHHICTGVLISMQDVLTANHCLTDYHPLGVEVSVGSLDLLLGQRFFPLWWMSYNQWSYTNNVQPEFEFNDIAIIKLIGNVPDNIIIATTAMTRLAYPYGSNVQVAGWGQVNSREVPRFLQKGTLTLLRSEECERRILDLTGESLQIHERRICTGASPYVFIDCGDSGGPLVYHDIVIAVNIGICPDLNETIHQDQINFHLSTYYYRHFIKNIKDHYEINF